MHYPIGKLSGGYEIPNSVRIIRENAFRNSQWLETVVIGRSVSVIESGAFATCNELETICFEGTEEEWNDLIVRCGVEMGFNNEDLSDPNTIEVVKYYIGLNNVEIVYNYPKK